jgi:hypothetical protein
MVYFSWKTLVIIAPFFKIDHARCTVSHWWGTATPCPKPYSRKSVDPSKDEYERMNYEFGGMKTEYP